MNRTVVILAAGTGTRISVWNKEVPKPLIPLCGMPLIERTIRTAASAGFSDFVVVTGYRGEEIRTYLGDGGRWGVRIRFAENPDWTKSNGISVLKAKPQIEGDEFVLLMADHVVDAVAFDRVRDVTLGDQDLILLTDPRIHKVFDLPDATRVKLRGHQIVDIG